nr:translation initiation factor IF-2-like [Aegilops tauschii subsp. strangulata]
MATTDTLQEGIVAPAGVTASEPDEPARISPALQTPPPNRSRPDKPAPNTMRHHGCATTHAISLRAPTQGQEDRREEPSDGSSSTKAEREGTTSTAVVREARAFGTVTVAVQTRQRGIPGHPWLGQAWNGHAKPRRPPCSRLASAPPAPHHSSPLPRLPGVTLPARPGPDGALRAQIWVERRHQATPLRRPAANDGAAARPRRVGEPRRQPDRRHLGAPPGAAPPRAGEQTGGEGQGAAALRRGCLANNCFYNY